MDETYGIKKIAGDKIALLGLFVAALLIARLFVAFKSVIVLSEPIILTRTGLSVSMPTGNGWRNEKQWKYQESGFVISSNFALDSSKPTAWAYCQYLFAAQKAPPQKWFEQKASELGGAIINMGQTRKDTFTIDWAYIINSEMLLNTFFGTADLPDNRRLNIEVHQIMGDGELAKRVFEGIIKDLKFENNQLLKAGAEIIAAIKSKGIGSFVNDINRQDLFLIKDSGSSTIGFTIDTLGDSGEDDKLNIKVASLFYIRGRYTFEQKTFFQSTNNLDEFTYKSESDGSIGRSGTEIILDKDGLMTVRKSSIQSEEANYHLSPTAIPDVFLEQLLGQMLQGNKKEIIVDIIDSNGNIIPAFVSELEDQEDIVADGKAAAYILKIEILDGRGFSGQLYLNEQKKIYKRFVKQQDTYIFERAGIEDLIREFPEQAEKILQRI